MERLSFGSVAETGEQGWLMRKQLISAAAIAAMATTATPVSAADEPKSGAFSIQFENDIFFDTDRHYTNGVALDYTTAPQDTPHWLAEFAHDLPFFASTGDVRTDYQIAQDIFTPSNTQLVPPDPTDRPYA